MNLREIIGIDMTNYKPVSQKLLPATLGRVLELRINIMYIRESNTYFFFSACDNISNIIFLFLVNLSFIFDYNLIYMIGYIKKIILILTP